MHWDAMCEFYNQRKGREDSKSFLVCFSSSSLSSSVPIDSRIRQSDMQKARYDEGQFKIAEDLHKLLFLSDRILV